MPHKSLKSEYQGAREIAGETGLEKEWWRECWRTGDAAGESLQGASPIGIKLSR